MSGARPDAEFAQPIDQTKHKWGFTVFLFYFLMNHDFRLHDLVRHLVDVSWPHGSLRRYVGEGSFVTLRSSVHATSSRPRYEPPRRLVLCTCVLERASAAELGAATATATAEEDEEESLLATGERRASKQAIASSAVAWS